MNRNAIEILKKQVENRQNYLQNTLEETQNLSSLAGTINMLSRIRLQWRISV